LKKFFKDLFNLTWTLIGFLIAWIVLEGEARIIVAFILVVGFIIWLATFKIRNYEEPKKS